MSLLILFVALCFVWVVLLLGGSLVVQSWLYNVPTTKIVPRAAASGVGLALFFTLWVALDQQSPGKYDSIFAAGDLNQQQADRIVSVRKGKSKEEEIPYKRSTSGGRISYVRESQPDKTWARSDADGMVTALLVKEPGRDEPTRFEIKLVDGKLPAESIYTEKGGSRYINASQLGSIVTPRSGSFVLRFLIAIVHLVLLVGVLWYGMNYIFGHALGLGFALWIFMTFGVMPILFAQLRPAPIKPVFSQPTTQQVGSTRGA